MKPRLITTLLLALIFLSSCATMKKKPKDMEPSGSLVLTEISKDDSYGLTSDNPVHVGGVADGVGPASERAYLDQLRGPNGETIEYVRTGNCCSFDTPRGFLGKGLLDIYEIAYEGLEKPISIYINMYDYDPPKAPTGFTIAN